MHIDKSLLLDVLKARRHTRHIGVVEDDLPNRIDPDEHADLLRRLGISTSELGDRALRAQETGGFGGFAGPGARIQRLGT